MTRATPMSSGTRESSPDVQFVATHWTVVLAAQEKTSAESQQALETLCRTYWFPLYAYVRRQGHSPADAEDLTQGFFLRLLEKDFLKTVDRDKGRFRTFLLVALKRFMANEWRRASAQRRGGAQAHVPIDTVFAETRYVQDATPQAAPDEFYDQQWALTLMELTVQRLQAEFKANGKPDDFEALKSCLMAARGEIPYAAVAGQMGVSEGAARVAVHRLRKRFREIYREEIARTLSDGADLEQELRHLSEAIARV